MVQAPWPWFVPLLASTWLCLAAGQAPSLAGRRELASALGKDDGPPTFELLFGRHTADGTVNTPDYSTLQVF